MGNFSHVPDGVIAYLILDALGDRGMLIAYALSENTNRVRMSSPPAESMSLCAIESGDELLSGVIGRDAVPTPHPNRVRGRRLFTDVRGLFIHSQPSLISSTSRLAFYTHQRHSARQISHAGSRRPAEDALRQNLGRPCHVRPPCPSAPPPGLVLTRAVHRDVDENGLALIYIDRCV